MDSIRQSSWLVHKRISSKIVSLLRSQNRCLDMRLTTAMSISSAAHIHKGYVNQVSSYVSIKLFQINQVLITPATVTMMPADSKTQTPMRCLNGMRRRSTTGIGRIVQRRSATQLIIPHHSVVAPSSKHCPSMTSGNCQYACTGLKLMSARISYYTRVIMTYMQVKTTRRTNAIKTQRLKARLMWSVIAYHRNCVSLTSR